MSEELLVIEQINDGKMDIATVINNVDHLQALINQIESEVMSVVPDLSTASGRKNIASLARKVASSKVAIDDAGKLLVAEWKAKSAKVDESRKYARDRLDAIRDAVRKPLTDWEAEQERIAAEEAARIKAEAEEKERIERERVAAIEAENRRLREEIEARERAEAQRLAAEKAENERIERERLIAERAAKEAEEKAARQIAEAEAARVRAEAEANAAQESAEAERLQAEALAAKRAQEAAEKAERDRVAAIESERKRIEAERQRIAAEEAKRAADVEHKKSVNNQILNDLISLGISREQAQAVIIAIVRGDVANVSIKY